MRAPSNMVLRSALLARTPLFSADLITINLVNGTVLRWTSFDHDVSFSGNTWASVGPMLQRSTWSSKNTTEVSAMEFILYSSGADYAAGNIKRLIHDGLFDGAWFQLDRAFMASPGDTSLGLVTLFGGRMGKVEIDALKAKITVEAANVVMQQNLPRNTYQVGCLHTLYDSGCTVDRAAHTATYVVNSANQLTINYTSPVPPPVDPVNYHLGVLRITDGPGAGQSRTIDSSWAGGVTVAYPLAVVPLPGEQFTITEGCNKTTGRCAQFNNSQHFRGFPYIPKAEYGL